MDFSQQFANALPQLITHVVTEVVKVMGIQPGSHDGPKGGDAPNGAVNRDGWKPASNVSALNDKADDAPNDKETPAATENGDAAPPPSKNAGIHRGGVPKLLGGEAATPADDAAKPVAERDAADLKGPKKAGVLAYEGAAMTALASKRAKASDAAKARRTGRGGPTAAAGDCDRGRGRGRGAVPVAADRVKRGRGAPDKKVGCALKMSLNDLLKPCEAKGVSRNAFGCRGESRAAARCKAKVSSDAVTRATKTWAWATMTSFWDKHNKH
jgi:hypothetical protein